MALKQQVGRIADEPFVLDWGDAHPLRVMAGSLD
jgi:hypothetical protein